MSKKDYIAIAKIFHGCHDEAEKHSLADGIFDMLYEVASQMSDYLASDNSRFDREKFLSACGVLNN